jgi:hypothetical protein
MRCVACLICFVLGWRDSTLYEAISEKPLVMMVSCQCLGPSGWASHRRFYSCSPLPALRDGCHYQPPIKDSQRHIDLAYEGLQGLLLSKTAAHAAEFLCRHARHSTTSTHPEAVIRFSQSSQRLVAKATQNLSGRFSMICSCDDFWEPCRQQVSAKNRSVFSQNMPSSEHFSSFTLPHTLMQTTSSPVSSTNVIPSVLSISLFVQESTCAQT